MPKLNPSIIKERLTTLDWSVPKLAEICEMSDGTLRNAVAGRDPIRIGRIKKISRALDIPVKSLVATNDGVPDEPPVQPKKAPTGPARRQDTETTKKAPRRAHGEKVT